MGINTLGVLYIVENGNAVQSLADLEGKTMVASVRTPRRSMPCGICWRKTVWTRMPAW